MRKDRHDVPDQPRVQVNYVQHTHTNFTQITNTQHTKYNEIGYTCFGLLNRHQAIIKNIKETRHCDMCQTHAERSHYDTQTNSWNTLTQTDTLAIVQTHPQHLNKEHKTPSHNRLHTGAQRWKPLTLYSQQSRFHCSMYIVTAYIYIYIHTHTHTHTYIYTHIYLHTYSSKYRDFGRGKKK